MLWLASAALVAAGCGAGDDVVSRAGSGWEIEPVSNSTQLFRGHLNTASVLDANVVFWGAGWAWQGVDVKSEETGQGSRSAMDIPGLSVKGVVLREQVSDNEIRWSFDLEASKEVPDVTGGGVSLVLDRASPAFRSAPEPASIDGGKSVTWNLEPGQEIKVAFEPAIAAITPEPSNPNEVRAWFYQGKIPAGKRQFTMTVTMPKTARVRPELSQRYGPANTATWFKGAMDPHQAFIDLSGLNQAEAPAGKRGFVRASGESLVFGDGTPARFWGCNVQAYSLFITDKALIAKQAERISRLGFNLVRLHHHDSARWVQPSLIADGPTSQKLNDQALDSYFTWIAELKKRGVYVFIDLHTGRPFRKGDQIPGFEDLERSSPHEKGSEAKGFTHVNPRLEALMWEFSRELLSRKNPYTGLALKDDPAVAGILLTNENDVTTHFGNALLGDKGVPYHHAIFNRLTEEFAKKHGLETEAVRRTWEAGPAKLFLNDLEYQFSRRWIQRLRGLGVKQPIVAGHQWGGNPLFSLPALTVGDVLDAHGYDPGEWVDGNPNYRSFVLHWLAAAQVEGKPFVVTEVNTEDSAGARDPFMLPLATGAMAAFQGWDAPMLYGYSQDGLGGGARDLWSSYTHPGVMGLMPAAALMFREGHIAPAKQTVVLRPSREQLFFQSVTPDTAAILRTTPEVHRLVASMPSAKEVPWLKSPAVKPSESRKETSQLDESPIPSNQTFALSDTGEIRRDWQIGVQSFDSPMSQGVQGWVGGRRIATRSAEFDIETRKAAVMLTSLDRLPISASKRILLSAVARVAPSDQGYVSEPVFGEVLLKREGGSLKLIPLNADGSRQAAVTLTGSQGRFKIAIPTDKNTHWFLLEP